MQIRKKYTDKGVTKRRVHPAPYTRLAYSIVSILKWGYAVVQLVEALRYKPEGRGFDS